MITPDTIVEEQALPCSRRFNIGIRGRSGGRDHHLVAHITQRADAGISPHQRLHLGHIRGDAEGDVALTLHRIGHGAALQIDRAGLKHHLPRPGGHRDVDDLQGRESQRLFDAIDHRLAQIDRITYRLFCPNHIGKGDRGFSMADVDCPVTANLLERRRATLLRQNRGR